MPKRISLPALAATDSEDIVGQLTACFNFPRTILGSAADIERVWQNLGHDIPLIKEEYRRQELARMVIAIRVGLFSSAVNEIWNVTIAVLREKIKAFGLKAASEFLDSKLDEKTFKQLTDKQLLDICVELGLLDDDAYFYLNHCREVRNNYSLAHPTTGMLDGMTLSNLIHQCVKLVLSNNVRPVGFGSDDFMKAVRGARLTTAGKRELAARIEQTNDLQRTAILKALFGIYVDETNDEVARQNCLDIARMTWEHYSEIAQGEIVTMLSGYLVQDNTKQQYAKHFFEKVNAIHLLPKIEQVALVSGVVKQLENTHHQLNNFHNEPAYAKRLAGLSKAVPVQIIKEYVYVVSLCFVGNQWGTSSAAEPYYKQIIENFTVREVDKLFELIQEDNYLSRRLQAASHCKDQFQELLKTLNPENIPSKWQGEYNKRLRKVARRA